MSCVGVSDILIQPQQFALSIGLWQKCISSILSQPIFSLLRLYLPLFKPCHSYTPVIFNQAHQSLPPCHIFYDGKSYQYAFISPKSPSHVRAVPSSFKRPFKSAGNLANGNIQNIYLMPWISFHNHRTDLRSAPITILSRNYISYFSYTAFVGSGTSSV